MRIVFWGSERGSNVTSNMLILAGYLACQKGYRIVLLELAEEKRGIWTYFPGIRAHYAKAYIHTLVRRQLYYISMDDWKRQTKETLVELIKYLERNMDMVFINLADRTDVEAKELIRNASLVVVNMKQAWGSFDRYFAHHANLSARVFLLIGNYYEDGGCDRERLQEKYRLTEGQLAIIPNNPEYQMACAKGRVERYMRRNGLRYMSAIKNLFFKNVSEIAEYIYENTKSVEGKKAEDR